MSGIDYSKWDKIDCSSSDEDDDEGGHQPRVTKLDAPSRVTLATDGNLVIEESDGKTTDLGPSTPLVAEQPSTAAAATDSTNKKPKRVQEKLPIIEDWTQNGSEIMLNEDDYPNIPKKLYWSQDRYNVTIRLELPATTIKGKDLDVNLQGVLPFRDRCAAVGNDNPASLKLTWTDPSCHKKHVLLEGKFPHPIHAVEGGDDKDDAELLLDWNVDRVTHHTSKKSNNNSVNMESVYWVLTVPKAVPMEGMVIWWRRPLQQFAEIEVKDANPNNGSKAQAAFQQNWEEAHRQFLERSKEKIQI